MFRTERVEIYHGRLWRLYLQPWWMHPLVSWRAYRGGYAWREKFMWWKVE